MTQLAVVIRPVGDGTYWAEIPTLPGCVSQGMTLDEIVTNIRGAAAGWLAYLRDKGQPQPEPDAVPLIIDIDA